MNVVKIALAGLIASGAAVFAVPAQAQASLESSIVAQQAAHSSDVRAIQARRDQHTANVAALHGDIGAARAFSHAADVRQAQSAHDARFSRRANEAARVERYYGN